MNVQTVAQAKRFEVITCNAFEIMGPVAHRMVNEDISTMVVVDEGGYLVGVLTRTDILRAYLCGEDWQTNAVEKYMSRGVVSVGIHTSLDEVAKILIENRIHRVIVIREEDGKPRPVAVFTSGDLVYHMVKGLIIVQEPPSQ